MSDLVERLRQFEVSDSLGDGDFKVCYEAADAIERLTAERDRLAAKLTRMTRSRDVWMRRAAAGGWPVFESEEAYLAAQEKRDE